MLQENVDLVRRIHRDWNAGGCPGSGLLDTSIEWVNPPDAMEPGIRRGLRAFELAAGKLQENFADVQIELERCIEVDHSRVVAIGTWHGRGRSSHVAVARRMGFLWTLRAGKAVRFEWFHDPAAALEAAERRRDQATRAAAGPVRITSPFENTTPSAQDASTRPSWNCSW